MKKVIIRKNRYVDSVSLMGISDRVMSLKGIENAEAQMATCANQEVLKQLGYELPKDVTVNDLVIAITAQNEKSYAAALQLAEDMIDHKNVDRDRYYHDLSEIDMTAEPYDLCQISLPGEYAAEEAKKALKKGMDVFIFSDNVSLEEELELKQLGRRLGRLVMGPDAGVALIRSVALAAGSIVQSGPVGIVAASGSGAQEIACIIEKCGMGVSGIIGTGGRDLNPQIGGITMLSGIQRMEQDSDTKVIVLVSKLADLKVMDHVLEAADYCTKPVVALFLGSDESLFARHKVKGVFSLESAALEAVGLAGGEVTKFGCTEEEEAALAEKLTERLDPGQKYCRGLYCGGTLAEEAMQYFAVHNKAVKLYSNLFDAYSTKLKHAEQSKGHTVLDLGAEDFTKEAPHPVFDPALRLKRLRRELEDPKVAAVVLDFITGPGVAEDPVTAFARECEKHPSVIFICHICGSLEDPQDVTAMERLLEKSGAIVTKSNYQSVRLVSALMNALERR